MLKLVLFAVVLFFLFPPVSFCRPRDQLDNKESFIRAEVLKILKHKIVHIADTTIYEETLQVKLLEGKEEGKIVVISRSGNPNMKGNILNGGDKVVIDSRPDPTGKMSYSIYEPYRLDTFWFVLLGFIILIVFIGGKKGIGAFIGLIISLLLISQWMIPQIVNGQDPVQVVIIAACIMLIVTTYIAHGLSLKTTVAVIGTAAALVFTGWISTVLVDALSLFGLGSEDVYQLQIGASHSINTQGLLLGAILIGTLGALNDITTTQSITIFTLVKENPKQKFHELFRKGMEIGKEHIASLINTLVLAYTGSSLGIFIFFTLNPANLPWWVILNNETTIEEIIKTLVGSSALILAVPFTTFIATFVALRGTNFHNFLHSISNDLGTTLKPRKKNK